MNRKAWKPSIADIADRNSEVPRSADYRTLEKNNPSVSVAFAVSPAELLLMRNSFVACELLPMATDFPSDKETMFIDFESRTVWSIGILTDIRTTFNNDNTYFPP